MELTFLYGRGHLDNPEAYLPTEPKKYKVFICRPPNGTIIYNKFEGSRYEVGEGGRKDIVISGTAGEMWCSPIEKVLAKYCRPDGVSLHSYIAEKFGYGDPIFDWIEVEVIPGAVKNFALFIPKHEQFAINTAWGASLDVNHSRCEHAEGDFIVCAEGVDGKPNLSDRWVLNGEIFKGTYKMRGKLAELNKGRVVRGTPRPEKSFIVKEKPEKDSVKLSNKFLLAIQSKAVELNYVCNKYSDSSCGVFVSRNEGLICVMIICLEGNSVEVKVEGCVEIKKVVKVKSLEDVEKVVKFAVKVASEALDRFERD